MYVFLSSYRNMSENLGEQEMLWEQELLGKCFHSFFEFSQTFRNTSIKQ